MKTKSLLSGSVLAIALVLAHGRANAQSAASASGATSPATGDSADTIIVTGTRTTGYRASDSPAPVQVIGNDAIDRVGQPDLNKVLAQLVPSIQTLAWGNDQTAFHPSIKLRGLNPNDTLILVNGKRRHATANVVVSSANPVWTGTSAPDVGLIPTGIIDRVELLQDGAAAQYGTDAIDGVINFILKRDDHGGTIDLTAGQYEAGDGKQFDVMGNIGLAPIPDMFLSLSGEYRYHGYSNRSDLDPRFVDTGQNTSANTGNSGGRTILSRFPGITSLPNYPYIARSFGDGEMKEANFFYNWGYDGIDHVELYSFGSFSRKVGSTYQSLRLPNVVYGKASAATVNTASPCPVGTFCDIPFPLGFLPKEQLRETDYSVTGGSKFTFGATTADISATYGRDVDKVYVLDSANAALYYDTSTLTTPGSSPLDFHNGDFTNSQLTLNLDLTRRLNIGLPLPVTIAGGLEWRREEYNLISGDPASYYNGSGKLAGGVQSYFGFSPTDASDDVRHNLSEYLDVTVSPLRAWLIDAAIRHEHYSDFGNTTIYKLTSRYDITSAIAVRGTVSTGFRAPTLAEGFYSGLNVSVASLSGIFAPNSAGSKALGINGLKPEKSTNFSAGIVLKPVSRLTMTVDGYFINLRDRIVQSSSFTGYSNNCQYLPGGFTPGTDVQAAYNAFIAGGGTCSGAISPNVLTALYNNGVTVAPVIASINSGAAGSLAVNSFVNGFNSHTRGIDLLTTYWTPIGSLGRIDWSVAVNYNATKATKIDPPPGNVNQAQNVVDKYAVSARIDSTPKWRATVGALWTIGKFEMNLRESYYGNSGFLTTLPTNGNQDVFVATGAAFLTDLELGVRVSKAIKFSVGADNLFDKYPREYPAAFRAGQYALSVKEYTIKYPVSSPFGVMGGYYYARLDARF